jgi:hypothetical protein
MSAMFSLLKTGLSWAGAIAGGPAAWLLAIFQFISSLWATEFGRLILVGLACLIGGWTWGWNHEHNVKLAALAARDTQWEQRIAGANEENESRLKSALAAAREVPQAPTARTDLLTLCKSDAACRKSLKPSR